MSARIARKLSVGKYLLPVAMAAAALRAQPPKFEVTSVKPPPAAATSPVPSIQPSCFGGRFVSRAGIGIAVRWAFGIGFYQLDGMPAWANTRSGWFDIEGASAGSVSEAQCRLMVQSLLADRFKLTVHHQAKVLDVYALVVAKNGPKIKQATDVDQDGVHVNGAKTYGSPKGWTMSEFADFLQRSFNPAASPVIDRTGLDGLYKLTLEYDPGPYDVPGVTPRGDRPDIFSALESQLGLKLERRKEPVDMIVVDRLEQPDAN